MKNSLLTAFAAIIVAAILPAATSVAQSGPPAPPILFLDTYSFLDTNFDSDYGYAPIGESNAFLVPGWRGNDLVLDTTNEIPAYVNYNIVETNGYVNMDLAAGAFYALVIPNWASADTNQLGQGPGAVGYLLAAGDWSSGSPHGLWSIYVDAAGTNLCFGGVSNSISNTYVSVPISWASNSIHMLGVYYDSNVSEIFLDGELAGTGGPVTIVPTTNTLTNGFYVGSDNLGYEQFRGNFSYFELDTTNVLYAMTNYFTSRWERCTNSYYSWWDSFSYEGDSMFFSGFLSSMYSSESYIPDITGSAVYMTNTSSSIVPGQGVTFSFAIEGGSNNVPYDVFSTTNLVGPKLTNSIWTWLGEGTNGGYYQITNQANAHTFYVLGTPELAPDGSGYTIAYEALIPGSYHAVTNTQENDIVVYGAPIVSSGSTGSCPGAYTGYINYTLTPAQGWGWAPSNGTTLYTASDTNRTNTKIEYVGAYGDEGCGRTTVTIPYPAYSPVYRFSIYFTNNVPTTNYPIKLVGFTP